MAKKLEGTINLQIPAGKANPAPPIGPALGRYGVNIMDFCKNFNAQTQDKAGWIIPVVISVYSDKSYTFIMKTPPASDLLKKAAKIEKGSGTPNTKKVGTVSASQIREIAEKKMTDLNTTSMESAISMIEGAARSMGIVVEG